MNELTAKLAELRAEKAEFDLLVKRGALSDEYLTESERGNPRSVVGLGGEYSYGIVMVTDIYAEKWLNTAISALETLVKLEGEE
jgi:hypothetical protein